LINLVGKKLYIEIYIYRNIHQKIKIHLDVMLIITTTFIQ